MIYAICGKPGSYKSCYAVEKFVLPALKKGRKVYTNIDGLNSNYISVYYDLDPIDCEQNMNVLGRVYDEDGSYHEDRERIRRFYEELPYNSLVIIDEAQNYFSSRDFKESFSSDLIPWLTKHRHLGIDVVWITQNLESVDITFRRNTHLTYSLRRAENIGMKNAAFVYIFDSADLERRHMARKLYRPDITVFKLYSSYQTEEVQEKRTSYNVFLRSPFIWFGLVVFGWAAYVLLSGSFSREVLRTAPQKIEAVPEEKKVVEHEKVEKTDYEEDDVCIRYTGKIRGELVYYFDDGSRGYDSHGRRFCRSEEPGDDSSKR